MDNTYKANLYYAVFLVFVGIIGFLARYLEQGDLQFTSLIPAAFGLILFPMTGAIKRENGVIGHIAVALTLLLAVVVTIMFVKNNAGGIQFDRKTIIFLVTGLVSYVVLGIYVSGFLRRREQ